MTLARIQALESLSFEWKSSGVHQPDDDVTCGRERAVDAPKHGQTTAQTHEDQR
jgi:hypothetical protein